MLKPRPVHLNTVLKSPLHTPSLRRELPILNITHQLPKLLSILNLYPRNPSLALRSFIDSARLLLQDFIRFYDLPRHGRHDVGGRFHGLHCADGVAGAYFEVGGGEIDEDDVAEVFGCVD